MGIEQGGMATTMLDVVRQWIDVQSGMADKPAFTYLDNGHDVSSCLTFAELDQSARSVAVRLQSVTQPGDRVLIGFPPGIDFVVAFFGCIYAGVVAVPAARPANARTMPRLLGIVEDAEVHVILSTGADMARLQRLWNESDRAENEVVWLSVDDTPVDADQWCPPRLMPEALAFIQYTSGSTGRPKGVMISHRSLLANLAHIQSSYGVREEDTLVSWLPQHHDFGLIGFILLPAFVRAHAILFPPAVFLMRPLRWLALISRYRARVTGAPNFAFDLCVKRISPADKANLDLSCLELAINGADRVRPQSMRRFINAFHECGFNGESLAPSYGLAESTLLVCASRQHDLDGLPKSIEISKEGLGLGVAIPPASDDDVMEMVACGPVSSGRHHVVIVDSADQESLAEQRIGEIWVAGASLGSGYWNKPEASKAAFGAVVPGDSRHYLRTGDLGFVADGHLYISGRLKEMMIFQGRNVFSHDIEATVEAQDAAFRANGCAAFSIEHEHGAELVLVQELESRATANLTGLAGRVRSELAECHDVFDLAALLLVKAGQLPRTSSGKIQRIKCRDLYLSGQFEAIWSWRRDEEAAVVLAAGDTTRDWVTRNWELLLGVTDIAPDADFFSMGGHSLLASQMISRIRKELGVDLSLRDFFEDPSIQGVAAAIERRTGSTGTIDTRPPLGLANRQEPLRLSWSQQRLWFLDQLDSAASVAYHLPVALRLHGALNGVALCRALDHVVARHEVLRTVFVSQDGLPVQQIRPAETGFAIEIVDLRVLDRESLRTEVARRAEVEARAPFDLSQGPLVRGQLLQLAEDEHVLLVTQHHIVSDGWSARVFIREVGALYDAFMQGGGDPLPALSVQYADYAMWQHDWLQGESLRTQLDFWTKHLAGAPAVLDLPTDRPRPAAQDYRGGCVEVCISPELTAALRGLAQAHGATLFMVLLAAWSALLARLSGQRDVVIGTPVANRQHIEIEPLVGFFVNTLALRVHLDDAQTTAELLRQVKASALGAYAHQDVPFEQVVEAVNPQRSLGHNPLFQAMLAFDNTPQDRDLNLAGLSMSLLKPGHFTTHFDLSLSLEDGDRLSGSLVYATALFDAATMERHRDYLLQLLEAMVADAEHPVARIDLLPVGERELLLHTWNQTEVPYPVDRCIHQLFEEQAASSPDAIALVQDDVQLTYAELNAQANRLAHRLIALGVQPDSRVAICVDRRPHMVIGLLAILKAGGAYVPLDPAYPVDRLQELLEDAQPVVLLADAAGRHVLEGHTIDGLPTLALDEPMTYALHASAENPDPKALGVTPSHLAYVIYTSGSTGKPKGVMVEHANTTNLLQWARQTFSADETAHTLFATSINFDLSVYECFLPLVQGSTLRLVKDALSLVEAPQDVSIINTVPSALTALLDADAVPASIRTINLAGEPLTTALAKAILERTPAQRLCNLYGPSETTTYSTWMALRPGELIFESIGRPIANTRIYLLDTHGQPVPLGAVGELYIGGAGVARGYLNRPDLTAERFLRDPFVGDPKARMYRTGDLARYLPDGNLQFLCRNDHQVKIRGFRIELGEIEARLAAHAAVREVVVLAREDVPGDKRLVAYVVAQPGSIIDALDLRAYVARQLPDYMLPSAIVSLEVLPRTPNGKLDRKALPAPDGEALAHRGYEAPQGKIEQRLADIWSELLGVERVGRHDHFFELGGHSLLGVRLIGRLRQAGLSVQIKTLFEHPTLANLAATVGNLHDMEVPPNGIDPDSTTITPEMLPLIDLTPTDIDRIVAAVPRGVANIQDIYALSPLQDGILFHHLLTHAGDPYLLANQIAFADRTILERFLGAVQQVVDRHDILRTAFLWEGLSIPAQVVWRKAPLSVTEVSLDADGGTASEQLARRFDPRHTRIDLTRAPALQFFIAQEPNSPRWVMQCLQHHLVSDHSTLEIIYKEVIAILEDRGHTLPPPQPFRNLVAQTRVGPEVHEPFFRQMLGDIDEPTLPFGLSDVHLDGHGISECHRLLPLTLNDRLRHHARRLGVSLASLCHLAFGQVVARCSGREAVVFGTVLFGRMQGGDGADQAIGPFINTLPLRLDLDETPVEQSVRQTHQRLAELLLHEHAPLTLAQRCSGVASPMPLFSALLNYRHNQRPQATAHAASTSTALDGIGVGGGQERTNYPFALSVEDYGQALGLTPQVVDGLSPEHVCDLMQSALEHLVEALEQAPTMPVRQLNVLSAAERELLHTWNRTEAFYPADRCIHQLFEEQVTRTPDAIAVVQDDVQLTYAQLNAQANRLAHRLIEQGVRPDSRVAICVDRRPHMVVGLLAILKAGGAYVPMDPAYPVERLHELLTDAEPVLLLTDAAGWRVLAGHPVERLPRLFLDEPLSDARNVSEDNPNLQALGLTSSHLAYVIYTSGSTGKPKGVMIEHRSLVNYVWWDIHAYYRESQGGSPTVFSISFDAGITTLFGALMSGQPLTLLPVGDETQILGSASSNRSPYCLVKMTPSHLKLLNQVLQDSGAASPTHTLMTGGEAIAPKDIAFWQQRFPNVRLVNHFGPTETTVGCATFEITRDVSQWHSVPIGRPISNAYIYVLDRHGSPVPLGVTGELYIGGAGVARGYLNRPELTAERFLSDPFAADPTARMYLTGDLARYRPDGNLEFLGRNDHQVKLRGFRIELGEIEARLAEHAAVREAVVLAREDVPGDKWLVAYVTAQPDALIDALALRGHLARQLPNYMVPAAFVSLDALPLTPNGKLDRKALPAPDGAALVHRTYEAPQGEIEQRLAEIWSELLDVERVGRYDDFFELGGHSLLAIRMLERLRRQGLIVATQALFTHSTLSELARVARQFEEF